MQINRKGKGSNPRGQRGVSNSVSNPDNSILNPSNSVSNPSNSLPIDQMGSMKRKMDPSIYTVGVPNKLRKTRGR